MSNTFEKDGQTYLRIGDRAVPVELDENGIPIVKVESKEIKHADGSQDVVISVPCLQIKTDSEG